MVAAGGRGKRAQRFPAPGLGTSSVYSYMRLLMPVLRGLGFTPVKRVLEGGVLKYKEHVSGVYLLQVACECIFITYLTTTLVLNLRHQVLNLYSFNAIELFACVMFSLHVVGAKCKTLQYRRACVESFQGLHEVDELMRRLGIAVSYRGMIRATRALLAACAAVWGGMMVGAVGSEAHFVALVLQLFACVMFSLHVVGAKCKTLQYRRACVESFQRLHEVDELMRRLGIAVSYRGMTRATRALLAACAAVWGGVMVGAVGSEAHFVALVLQIWRIAAINMFGLFLILLYHKYRNLNTFLKLYIKENEEGIPLTDTTLEPLEVIDTIANVYDKLCTSGKKWNDMHNLALSINLLFYAVASTLFSIAYYTSPKEMVPMIPVFIFLFLEFFYVLTISQITRNECQKIMLNINEMSCCYIDNDLWRARNSFLLQTLHQKVNFTVLHVFPLDHSMAVKIGGIVLSVLVLTIQIRSLEEAQ